MVKTQVQPKLDIVLRAAKARYQLSLNGIHGPSHWHRVRENGLRLAKSTKADVHLVELFAFLHDCAREDDCGDPDHGPRAVEYIQTLRGDVVFLKDKDFEILCEAIHDHTFGRTHNHPTIATCWDADRLDIGRVGRKPNPRFLSTDEAKKPGVISWAWRRSRSARR